VAIIMPKAYAINPLGCIELTLALKNRGLLSLHCIENCRIARIILRMLLSTERRNLGCSKWWRGKKSVDDQLIENEMEQAVATHKKGTGAVDLWRKCSVFAKCALCRTRPGLKFHESIDQI
jgi:hypothetical protein